MGLGRDLYSPYPENLTASEILEAHGLKIDFNLFRLTYRDIIGLTLTHQASH